MILVNAANGNQGKLLIPRLLRAGAAVRACVRTEAAAAALRASGIAEVVVGDIGDPAVVGRAVRGVDKVYHVCPTMHPLERAIGFGMIDAARAEGVEHFVLGSVLHPHLTTLVQHEIKRDIEEHLIASDLPFTILQPAIYMLPLKLRPAFEQGRYTVAWSPDRRQSLVDIGDVADVVATVLTHSEDHLGATYELSGAERLTARDMARIIGEVMGRAVPVEEIAVETFLGALFGDRDRGSLDHQVRAVRSLNTCYSAHDFVGNPNVLRWLLGRESRSFEAFVREQYAAFVEEQQA